MKRTILGKVCVTAVLITCLLAQGCSFGKSGDLPEPEVSVSASQETVSEKTSVSKEEQTAAVSTEASIEEPEPEPEEKENRPEGLFLRLTQDRNSDPLVIDIYEDGSYVVYPGKNPAEKDKGDWNYSNGALCLAASTDELIVNEFTLGEKGFTYYKTGSSGFPQRDVKDKDFFVDTERVITAEEFEEYQQKLGGAPFHARFPSVYGEMDEVFLGDWKDQSGMFTAKIFKISAEVGGYSFTITDAFGNEVGSGDAHIEGEGLVMHQGNGALAGGINCSAVKSDTGITVTLDSEALANYGIPAGDQYNIYLTR